MQFQSSKDKILIIDFGSQVTKLIARRIRELGASEIVIPNEIKKLKDYQHIKGIILSGGPSLLQIENLKLFQRKFLKKKYQF